MAAELKKIIASAGAQEEHWVGDGFFVSTIFSVNPRNAQLISPFLLMDHGVPRHFDPSPHRRGVGEHPHRGFETVTFSYAGEVEHRDSGGGGGRIGPGDVQWMTAASGVVHEEKHSAAFTASGGEFEMVQLWVNLPAAKKMSKPRYQGLLDKDFPRLNFTEGIARGRLVAGDFHGRRGPAFTETPMRVFDIDFLKSGEIRFDLPEKTNTLIFALRGEAELQGSEQGHLAHRELAVFGRDGTQIQIKADTDARFLILNGEPIDEPVVAYGPFVMNSKEEIEQALRDYSSGKMGHLTDSSSSDSGH